tara:strand:- start:92 stop:676 length:585 start_codon:yes stop_codon:yes gene_type:complete
MNARTLVGLMLIVGGILNFGGWGASAALENTNVGLTKVSLSIATLGMLILAAGFYGLTDSMAKGTGQLLAQAGLVIYVIGTAVAICEPALIIGAAEANAAGNQALGETLDAVQLAIASAGVGVYFLGFAIIGIGIFIQRNLNVFVAVPMIVMGLIGAFLSVYDYESELMLPSYAATLVLPLAAGILFIKSRVES